ncbi:putative RNA-directed DNA polymerase [Helianthus anomalus]
MIKLYGLSRLNREEADRLIIDFNGQEVKEAVFDCGSNKAPGPDGFNFGFIKKFWEFFRDDFVAIMQQFHQTGKISKGVGSSFITLIPKVGDPTELGDFRPINLIGIISKVVSKVLANRLKSVMAKIVSESQTAFLTGRYILDGPLMANEVLSWARKSGKKMFMFKIDFDKAYDNVNWEFLISVLDQIGFPALWQKWIRGILVSARSSILVNGSPTFEFDCQKGLRQGDPISPFLFILVMEAFSGLVNKASCIGAFDGVRLSNDGFMLSHLLYADDAMLMRDWSNFNFSNLKRMLRIFYLCSGLRINLNKSVLFGVGVSSDEVNNAAEFLKCKAGVIPFLYLGIKVGANMNRVANWDPVVNTFRQRLSKWKANTLSIGGRLTLVKSVLHSLPTYYMSLFKAPIKVVNILEGLMRRFLWGGSDEVKKMSWVAWEIVTKPKDEGGLGVSRLEVDNKALLVKWLWRYHNDQLALWRRVIDAIHGSNRRWGSVPVNMAITGIWKNCGLFWKKCKVEGVDVSRMIRGKVGNGEKNRFWIDCWLCQVPLKDRFVNLFSLERQKHINVAARCGRSVTSTMIKWDWRRAPESSVVVNERMELERLLRDTVVVDKEDTWEWNDSRNIEFSVSAAKNWLRGSTRRERFQFQWSKWVPSKCNIFMWRAFLDRLPTKVALMRRRIFVENIMCVWCHSKEESIEHLLTGCHISAAVWSGISRWCRVPEIYAFGVKDLVELHEYYGGSDTKKLLLHSSIIIVCWRLWRARNETVFSSKDAKVGDIIADVKSFGFLWYKHRFKQGTMEWDRWCRFDVT